MKHIIFLKDNIAVAKSHYKSLDNIDLGVYDSYVEMTEQEYNSVILPSEKINGKWVKTDTFPKIEYPKSEIIPEPLSETELTTNDMAIAILEGVNEV